MTYERKEILAVNIKTGFFEMTFSLPLVALLNADSKSFCDFIRAVLALLTAFSHETRPPTRPDRMTSRRHLEEFTSAMVCC